MNCCICGDEIKDNGFGWTEGNNAQPLSDGRCCDFCDKTKVLPARLEALRTYSREQLISAEFGMEGLTK